MNDTPMTDDIARGNHVVPTEFAQDLERQLRSARDRCWRLGRERNNLRAEIRHILESIRVEERK